MGRFEDLIEAAEQGDPDALASLKAEFSGSSLREKAESADTFKNLYESNLPLIRQAKVGQLLNDLGDEASGVTLTADDFKDVDPDSITLDMVKQRAKSQLDAAQESRLSIAKEAGFDTVEEFDTAMAAVKETQAKRQNDLEQIGGGAVSNGGQPAGSEAPLEDVAREAFEKSKKLGKADDRALADAAGALIDRQLSDLGIEVSTE